MANIDHLYPPPPDYMPADITTPSPRYRQRIVAMLLSIIVFLFVYLALTAGSVYLCYYCFSSLGGNSSQSQPAYQFNPRTNQYYPVAPPRRKDDTAPFVYILGGIASGLVFLFMIKGLFKRSRQDPGVRVEVTEEEQPTLFAFIERVCRDTNAPFPHRIYLVPDVNAAVAYHESFLSLVMPGKKNLIIGLGLVNRLNLTEFKAVLAHEFGHFSQKSMKLGTYVYTANRVVADVVYRRDWLDDLLAGARNTDIRIAIFAWTFSAGLWVLRKSLEGMFRVINFAHTSLSREMEYNADRVAVSVTGSDALIFALARLDFASETLGLAWNDLTAAADHNVFTTDLYYHQTQAAEFLKKKRNDPKLGEVPPLPDDPERTVQVFQPEDTSVPKMWATHPSNYDREVNAKEHYVRGVTDERSAWELFDAADDVRAALTRKVYKSFRPKGPIEPRDPFAVQAFIDAEHAETTYDPKYHGLYDNRYIKPGDLNELTSQENLDEFADPARVAYVHDELSGEELQSRMEQHRSRQQELNRLTGMVAGAVELTGKDFEHRGKRYPLADAGRLLKRVEKEIDGDFEWMHLIDRESFRVHYAMACQVGREYRDALMTRYEFHLALQNLHAALVAQTRHVQATLGNLAGRRQVQPQEFQDALTAIRSARAVLSHQLDEAENLRVPALTNMTEGEPVGPYLLSKKLVKPLPANAQTLDGQYIGELMTQFEEVLEKGARVLFKSMGGLLATQQRIAERWAGQQPPLAEVVE